MAKVIYEFDMHEDHEELKVFEKAMSMRSAIFECQNLLGNREKHWEDPIGPAEERLINDLRNLLSLDLPY